MKDPAVDYYLQNKDKLNIPQHSIDDNTGDMEGPAGNTNEKSNSGGGTNTNENSDTSGNSDANGN
jgi:uncharacterized protein YjcR